MGGGTRCDYVEGIAPYTLEDQSPRKECNDALFAILFLGVLIMTAVFAISYGPEFIDAPLINDVTSGDDIKGYKEILNYVVYCGLAGIGFTVLWIFIMIIAGEFLIWVAILAVIGLSVLTAIVFTLALHDRGEQYYWWPAAAFGSIALLVALYACCVRKRIKFAAAHLNVAGTAILSLPVTLLVAIVMAFVQFAWVITSYLGLAGILYHQGYIELLGSCDLGSCDFETKDAGAVAGVMIGMALVYFWGQNVFANIVHVTTAGTLGGWKIKSVAPCLTVGAWLRAITLSFGSICLGSLFVAVLETAMCILHVLANVAKKSHNCVVTALLCCLSCCMNCLTGLIEWFNRFAFTYVGIYGYSFVTAGRHTFKLFAKKGWSAIVNDSLTHVVFFLGSLISGIGCAWIGVELVEANPEKVQGVKFAKWLLGTLAFFIGYAVSKIIMNVMESGVTTVFVLWAEDPHGWELSHPDQYATLHKAWQTAYPEEYQNGHGKQQNLNEEAS